MKQCMTDLQKIMPFSFLKKIINENNEIPCFVILQHKYRFRANLNLLANRPSLPAAFIVGPLVLQRERETETETERDRQKYQYNTTQVQGSKLTNAQWLKSAVDCTYRQNSFLQNYATLYTYQVLLKDNSSTLHLLLLLCFFWQENQCSAITYYLKMFVILILLVMILFKKDWRFCIF